MCLIDTVQEGPFIMVGPFIAYRSLGHNIEANSYNLCLGQDCSVYLPQTLVSMKCSASWTRLSPHCASLLTARIYLQTNTSVVRQYPCSVHVPSSGSEFTSGGIYIRSIPLPTYRGIRTWDWVYLSLQNADYTSSTRL